MYTDACLPPGWTLTDCEDMVGADLPDSARAILSGLAGAGRYLNERKRRGRCRQDRRAHDELPGDA